MSESEFKYYAFVSYSHRDKQWGDWLHKSLETYRVPPRLVGQPSRDGQVPARIAPVFRDREELPTASDLSNAINDALKQSRYLIVICSPRSAKSRWVNEEILEWKRMGKSNRILCLIVDGEPNASDSDDPAQQDRECFPPAVRFEVGADGELSAERAEPIAADARAEGDNKRDAKLKLMAGLLGVGFDSLKQREMQRRARRLAAIAVAATVLLAVTSTLAVLAVIARGEAVQAQAVAEQRERDSRRMLVNNAITNGSRETNNDDPLTALLWHAHALKLNEGGLNPQPQDERTARLARVRLHFLLRDMPVPELTVFHDDRVVDARWSADGKKFVTASSDKTARIWNALTGETIGQPIVHQHGLNFIEISPDGRYVATGADTEGIRVSDGMTGETLIKNLHEKVIPFSASFSPDSKRLATGVENEAIIWDVATGKPALPPLKHNGGINAAVFSPDGQWIVTGGSVDKTAQVWNATTGEPVGVKMLHLNALDKIHWSADSSTIVTITFNERARVWSATGQPLSETLPMIHVHGAALSPDGKRIAIIGEDGTVEVRDLAKPEKPLFTRNYPGIGKSITFSPDGQRLVVAYDLDVVVIDLQNMTSKGKPAHVLPITHRGMIEAVQISPDATRLLTTDSSGTARISRIAGRGLQGEKFPVPLDHKETSPRFAQRDLYYQKAIYGHNANEIFAARTRGMLVHWQRDENGKWNSKILVNHFDERFDRSTADLSLLPDGKSVSVTFGDTVWIIDPTTGEQTQLKEPNGKRISFVDFSPDGRWLLIRERGETLWDLRQKKVVASNFIDGGVTEIAFTPDGKRLVTCKFVYSDVDSTQLEIWNVDELGQTKPKPLARVELKELCRRPVVSPDGQTFALSEETAKRVTIRDINTGQPIGTPLKHTADIVQMVFVPNTHQLLTSDSSDRIRVWDLETRKTMAPPIHVLRDIGSVNFSPNGELLYSVGFRNIRLWDPTSGQSVWSALEHGRYVSSAAFSPTGEALLITTREINIWPIKATARDANDLLRLAQWHAQKRIDPTGAAIALRQDEVIELWEDLKSRPVQHP